MPKTEVTRADIISLKDYEAIRVQKRKEMVALKKKRRLSVGPYATFFFENYETMWYQIHEMLITEKGGEAQIQDELDAYNPLIPKGKELVATLMFEIEDPVRRLAMLGQLGGIEETFFIQIGDEKIKAYPELDQERSEPDGRTASVHFLHFPFTQDQVEAFKKDDFVLIGTNHPHYGHMSIMPKEMRIELGKDFF